VGKVSSQHKLKATFEMIDLGLLHYYLGMQVYQYKDCTYLSQSRHISNILQKFGMEECRYAAILVSPGITISLSSNSQLVDATTYRQLIGSLSKRFLGYMGYLKQLPVIEIPNL